MLMELRRPLAFIDLESTGTSPERDRIVERNITAFKLADNFLERPQGVLEVHRSDIGNSVGSKVGHTLPWRGT